MKPKGAGASLTQEESTASTRKRQEMKQAGDVDTQPWLRVVGKQEQAGPCQQQDGRTQTDSSMLDQGGDVAWWFNADAVQCGARSQTAWL